ncbi:hypothetical protein [Variovorax sp. HJSM1_2]|uniref:hypothetical protein n=1 Tax=Variovorax sp. HJSM1_2 TaxID=3366263 RepID=UPI003BC2A111
MPLTVGRAFKLYALAASLSLSALAHAAHPLDFLTPEQRVFMMNKFLQSQEELKGRPGQAGAVDGSGATPLTPEQRVKLLNWFVTGKSGDESVAADAAASVGVHKLPAAAVLPLAVSAASVPQPAVPPPASAAAPGEADIAALFDKWPALTQGVSFERFRDGFAIDGARYLDPEGRITSYGFDASTGDFTYLAQTGAGQFVLKSGRAASGAEPIEIAKAESRGGMWSVVSASGKKFSGQRLIPLARGFIVARDNTGYRYVPGKGMTSFAAPEAFSIASLQSGNVSGTGYLLLERNPEQQAGANNSLGALIGSVKALGSTLGMTRKDDYALLNIDNRKLVPINIAIEDKQVQIMSACRQRNFMMAECQRMDSYESLFQANGAPNMTHYFWRINWFNAEGRPILVSQEGGLTQVVAADLGSGQKTALFERAMGIASFSAVQGKDGKIAVTAQMGFSSEKKEDVVTLLDAAPVVAAAK